VQGYSRIGGEWKIKRIIVKKIEENQRLDKFLARCLKEAPKSFLYKMLRKKNITLNGKRADGKEKVQQGDEICFFLSDETFLKFSGQQENKKIQYPVKNLDIIYEDQHVLLVNKPVKMLSQKAKPSDISLNEYVLGYLQKTGQWEDERWKPSVCNRLDENTSGIVVCGKSLAGLQQVALALKDRTIHKSYLCLAAGRILEHQKLEGYLRKNSDTNRVEILNHVQKDSLYIATEYTPLQVFSDCTLLEVYLITGRSHQIRAHLAAVGHPLIGDYKYGDKKINQKYKENYGLNYQLLHASRLEFPKMQPPVEYLSGRVFEAEMPELMKKIVEDKKRGV